MRRVIITGATGTIGTALINELINRRIEVLVLCRESSKRNENIPINSLVTIKYCSMEQLKNLENDTGKTYDVFYHFAWAGTSGVARNDTDMQCKNIEYALDAVDVAKRFGCHTFIGAGSQAEYGRVEGKLKPDTPAFPENDYGIAKLCAGQLTRQKAHSIGLKHIWVRVLSIYGSHDGAQSMVMSTINKLKAGEIPQFTKGEQMWDYLYSTDAASAFCAVGDKGVDGKIYTLGSGKVRQLKEYIEDIRNCVAPQGKIEIGAIPYAPKQVMFLQADISEITADTGWLPKYSFDEGLRDMLKQ